MKILSRRKFVGFLVSMDEVDARVIFVTDRGEVPYDLPIEYVVNAGITLSGQPFEIEEVESESDMIVSVESTIRPLAMPEDAFLERIQFNPERRAKFDRIISHFRS